MSDQPTGAALLGIVLSIFAAYALSTGKNIIFMYLTGLLVLILLGTYFILYR